MADDLKPQWKAFADYYIKFGNTEKAAIEAGYSKNYARKQSHNLLANVGIKKYIDERLEQIASERIAPAEEVLQFLTSTMRGEVKDQFGLDPTLSDRIKAAELLGKRYALFTDKKQITGAVPVVIVDDIVE